MEDQPERNRDINNTDDMTTTRMQSQTAAIDEIESEHEETVDNDHTLADATTERQLSKTSAALAREKTKRRSRPGLVILICLLMALLGAAAGIVLYQTYFEKAPAASTTTTASSTTANTPATAAELVNGVKSALKGTAVKTTQDKFGSVENEKRTQIFASLQAYRPAGYSFSTYPKELSSTFVTSASADVAQTDLDTIRSYLEKQGLHATVNRTDGSTTDGYYNDTTLCSVTSHTGSTSEELQNFTGIACADITSYEATAKNIQPFFAAYEKVDAKDSSAVGLLLAMPTTTNSKTAGYKTATVAAGNTYGADSWMLLFYQTPNNVWHFFKGVQNDLPCSDYNTTDLKKAYLDTSCTDTNGKESSVAL